VNLERWIITLPLKLRSLFRRSRVEAELDEELRDHVERQSEHLISVGMSPAQARRTAVIGLGGVEPCKEECRDRRATLYLEDFFHDLRFAARMLQRNPVYSAFIVLIFAIGVGGNIAIFTIINSVLIRPLPYPQDSRLAAITETVPRQQILNSEVSYPLFTDWQRESPSFESVGAYFTDADIVLDGHSASHQQVAYASASLFPTMSVKPILGGTFSLKKKQPADTHAAILGEQFWREHFNGESGVLGKPLTIGSDVYTIIGVLPSYVSPRISIWLPLESLANLPFMQNRDVRFLTVIGRLRSGVAVSKALSQLSTIQKRAQESFPGIDAGNGVYVQPLRDFIVGARGRSLVLLGAAVFCLLLVACGNIAGLMLERSAARQREFAMRTMLGAPKSRMVRQILTESLLLATLGGLAGLIASGTVISSFVRAASGVIPPETPISFDQNAWWFVLAAIVLTAVATGLGPALAISGDPRPADRLKSSSASTLSTPPRQRARRWLLTGEVALTVVLLCAAGLLITSLIRVMNVNPGFRTDHLLAANISLPSARYSSHPTLVAFFNETCRQLESLPGVAQVSAVSTLPVNGGDSRGFITIEKHPVRPGQQASASFRRVLPNYFEMMGIPIISGREFQASDQGARNGSPMVVLINEQLSKQLWPGRSPLGERIKIGPPETEPWLTIVGVVGDVQNTRLEAQPDFATYEPFAQRSRDTMTFVLRTKQDPHSMEESVIRTIRQREPQAAIFDVMTMDQRIASSIIAWKLNAFVMGAFGGLAFLLAITGIYATISFSVRQRTAELGLRMALGAQPGSIMAGILREGLAIGIIGVGLGAAVGFAVAHAIHSMLFGVSSADPVVFGPVALVVIATVLLASFVPASRATRIDPTEALRAQ